jgi:hypothetical protein
MSHLNYSILLRSGKAEGFTWNVSMRRQLVILFMCLLLTGGVAGAVMVLSA